MQQSLFFCIQDTFVTIQIFLILLNTIKYYIGKYNKSCNDDTYNIVFTVFRPTFMKRVGGGRSNSHFPYNY